MPEKKREPSPAEAIMEAVKTAEAEKREMATRQAALAAFNDELAAARADMLRQEADEDESLIEEIPAEQLELEARIRDLERSLELWKKRYTNLKERVEAFDKLNRVIQSLGFEPPSHFRE